MAIYHLEAKVVSRGAGRSAVAASAYLSCSRMYNDYDGVQHDYTKKHGLIYQEVILPSFAPPEWSDREQLWNAVETVEKARDSRLAREFVVALPIELTTEQHIPLLRSFIQEKFVSQGMCADFAIHDTDGHNPHAHIMLTVRPLKENGSWQHKTEKEYLCIKDDEERGFTASEFKQANQQGWEKQYQYKVGKKKVYMTTQGAQCQDYERVSKYPKSTKFGRQNPISERWNSEEQLLLWRESWADTVNHTLAQYHIPETIDHRSFKELGLLEQPTIHEGGASGNIEKKGLVSDRKELNKQIRADNKLLREIKKWVEQLMKSLKENIPSIAEALEGIRERMIIMQYHFFHDQAQRNSITDTVEATSPIIEKYHATKKKIQKKRNEKKALSTEKKETGVLSPLKHMKLNQQITTLTEEIAELETQKNQLMYSVHVYNESEMKQAETTLKQLNDNLVKLNDQISNLTRELENETANYEELKNKVSSEQSTKLLEARLPFRETAQQNIHNKLFDVFGQRLDYDRLHRASDAVDTLLTEDPNAFRDLLLQKRWTQEQERREHLPKKPKRNRDLER